MEHSRIGNPSRVVSPLAKTARELYGRVIAGQARRASCMRGGTFVRFSGQKPRASCAVGSQSRDRRHPRAEFPQFRMPLQRGVRARGSGPEENPLENSSPRAIFGQLVRATRGVHERRLNFGTRAEFSGMQRRRRRGRARVGGPIARGEGRSGSPPGPLGGPIVLRGLDEQRNDKGRDGHGEEDPEGAEVAARSHLREGENSADLRWRPGSSGRWRWRS